MLALLQRVAQARVDVDGRTVGAIGPGLLVFVCAEASDGDVPALRLVDKLLKLRNFADAAGKMNRSVVEVAGGLLIVSQFTLAARFRSSNGAAATGPASAARRRPSKAAGFTKPCWPRRAKGTRWLGRFRPPCSAPTCRSAW